MNLLKEKVSNPKKKRTLFTKKFLRNFNHFASGFAAISTAAVAILGLYNAFISHEISERMDIIESRFRTTEVVTDLIESLRNDSTERDIALLALDNSLAAFGLGGEIPDNNYYSHFQNLLLNYDITGRIINRTGRAIRKTSKNEINNFLNSDNFDKNDNVLYRYNFEQRLIEIHSFIEDADLVVEVHERTAKYLDKLLNHLRNNNKDELDSVLAYLGESEDFKFSDESYELIHNNFLYLLLISLLNPDSKSQGDDQDSDLKNELARQTIVATFKKKVFLIFYHDDELASSSTFKYLSEKLNDKFYKHLHRYFTKGEGADLSFKNDLLIPKVGFKGSNGSSCENLIRLYTNSKDKEYAKKVIDELEDSMGNYIEEVEQKTNIENDISTEFRVDENISVESGEEGGHEYFQVEVWLTNTDKNDCQAV
ncbi:hypothetical protein C1752_01579 [Acaryochloris thomasi RCC1774]|uniref:Uncharacterized protein n=1 Tax=Acaryochloris thomasi RCC1774 TaxID=1764569 RepID=A0A2W1JQY0_9CYAN|nr:hypothetical protein [Acaryochloris thomasi]PZD73765.1 hypothetical protein C1752_01579 [Acaryochloris thomasi RCC1774]